MQPLLGHTRDGCSLNPWKSFTPALENTFHSVFYKLGALKVKEEINGGAREKVICPLKLLYLKPHLMQLQTELSLVLFSLS